MKKFVINLKRRPDRKEHFIEKNPTLEDYTFVEAVDGNEDLSEYKTRPGWIDPYQNRGIVPTEVACFLSHRKMWEKCVELNEPIYVIEDDAIINTDLWDEEFYDHTIKYWDMLYLQRNENKPEFAIKIGDRLERPWYPYNTTAYVICPKGAKKLLNTNIMEDGIIPVDEYIPEQIRNASLMALALQEDSCNQAHTDVLASDIRNDRRDMTVHVITIGTDITKMKKLYHSASKHYISINNWGFGVEWKGTDMTGPGGGMKVNILKKHIADLPDTDILLFTDAYDVFYSDSLVTIKERYLDMGHKVLFSAEEVCWPDPSLGNQFPSVHTKYRYLNSGTFIGEVGELKKILEHEDIEDHQDDQLFYQKAYLEGIYDIGLDVEGYIFQCHEPNITMLGEQLYNQETKCCPCIYHGNGGPEAKEVFERIYKQRYDESSPIFSMPADTFEVIDKDMLLIDFMTEAQCAELIELAEKNGDWKSLPNDTTPAQELRLKELNLYIALEEHWEKNVKPIIEKYWDPLVVYGVRDAFLLRYSPATQSKLKLHHDASHVTGSVKLNSDYSGGELSFPRQGISNADIPVGKLLLFPGQVTHPHECLELTEGVKYSMTIWSQRYVGDIL
tara:strand:- start:4537 stop:6381 length:1845 start_codon:yes stop_codon:yes gene_type:complete